MKRFGFHPNQLYFNMRNPSKLLYVQNSVHGKFEVPKVKDTTDVNTLAQRYQQRQDFEKYMNPKGIKPTITSRFKKAPQEIDFVNQTVQLYRCPKTYEDNQVSFKVPPHMSKPEIKQFLSKVYNLPVQQVNTINKMGRMRTDYYH